MDGNKDNIRLQVYPPVSGDKKVGMIIKRKAIIITPYVVYSNADIKSVIPTIPRVKKYAKTNA